MGAEPQRGQGTPASAELPVGHAGPGVDQLHHPPLAPRRQDSARPHHTPPSRHHQACPGQGEELLGVRGAGPRTKRVRHQRLQQLFGAAPKWHGKDLQGAPMWGK